MISILIMSFSFLSLFMAYNTIQSFATSLFPGDLGSVSLAILYVSVVVAIPISPLVIARLGEKHAMVLGAACYCVYMASLVRIVPAVVYVTSCVVGFGAAILWIAQGSFITKVSDEATLGRNAGIFWTIFQFSNLLGSLIGFFVFKYLSATLLFSVLLALGVLGTLGLLFLPAQPCPPSASNDATFPPKPLHVQFGTLKDDSEAERLCNDKPVDYCAGMKEILWLLKRKEIYFLFVLFFWTGFELAFWTGSFPLLFSPKVIGLILAFAGAGEVISGFSIGWLSDRIGSMLVLFGGYFIYQASLLLSLFLIQENQFVLEPSFLGVSYGACLAAFGFGLGDSIFNTQTYRLIGQQFSERIVGAFTLFQLFQNIGSAVGFYYAIGLPLLGPNSSYIQVYIQAIVLSLSVLIAFVGHLL